MIIINYFFLSKFNALFVLFFYVEMVIMQIYVFINQFVLFFHLSLQEIQNFNWLTCFNCERQNVETQQDKKQKDDFCYHIKVKGNCGFGIFLNFRFCH